MKSESDDITTELDIDGLDEGDLQVQDPGAGIQLEKADRSLFELNHWHNKGQIVIDTEWQRMYVWDKRRASKLIESFLIALPVPVVYLAVNSEGKYEVIDGLQRLTSVFKFFNNEYALTGLEILTDLNGLKFEALDAKKQSKLEACVLRTFEIAQSTPKDLMFIIFERLNTGGVPLNDMEIRNCLYRGKLNDLIKSLSQDKQFNQALAFKGIEKRMVDRMLVLRFLAFYQLTYTKAKQGLKSFLNEFFETYRNPNPKKIKEYRDAFTLSQRAAFTIFGDKAYRLRRNDEKGGGEWAPRFNAAVFQVISVSLSHYDIGQLTRSADSIYEAYTELISTDDKWVDSVKVATADSTRLEYAFTTWEDRLKIAIGKAVANDKARVFSRELKDHMFTQNPTCSICSNRISSLLDAAMDHDVHYWKGGKTVPSNAKFCHRICNLQKPNG